MFTTVSQLCSLRFSDLLNVEVVPGKENNQCAKKVGANTRCLVLPRRGTVSNAREGSAVKVLFQLCVCFISSLEVFDPGLP